MSITEQNITDYIAKSGQQAKEHASVWAVRMPSIINMALFGPVAVLFDMRYNILNVSEQGIMLIGVDNAGKLTPIHVWFPKENIKNIQIKKGILSNDIQIGTAEGVLKYRINKIMVGSNFQKNNFEHTLSLLQNLA